MKALRTKDKLTQLLVLMAVVAVTIALTVTFVKQNQSSDNLNDAKSRIGKLILLPEGEEPTLAVVEDTGALKDAFLKKNTQKGDQLLIYPKTRQVVIYRPGIDKIVAVNQVTVDAAQAQAENATISIRNGTNDPDIANELKDALMKKFPTAKITTQNANKRDFMTTNVIDNNDAKDDLFAQILDEVNGSRAVVPLGEQKAETDIVIFVGRDYLDSKRI